MDNSRVSFDLAVLAMTASADREPALVMARPIDQFGAGTIESQLTEQADQIGGYGCQVPVARDDGA